jgi:SNF2 family DNA or RNA helicase
VGTGRKQQLHPTKPERVMPGWAPGRARVTHAAAALARELYERQFLSTRRQQVEAALASGDLNVDVLKFSLHPYQLEGAKHLVTLGRGLLCDDMGLGKTVQAIAAAQVMHQRGEVRRCLVLCPTSLRLQWVRELKKFAGVEAVPVVGTKPQRARLLASHAQFNVMGYEAAIVDREEILAANFDLVIMDEAQRAKNFRTKTAKTAQQISSRFLFVLTGTPVENKLDEIYSLCQLVDKRMLGPLWWFN